MLWFISRFLSTDENPVNILLFSMTHTLCVMPTITLYLQDHDNRQCDNIGHFEQEPVVYNGLQNPA